MTRRTKIVKEVPEWIEQAMINYCNGQDGGIQVSFDAKEWRKHYWMQPVEVVATRTAFEWFGILLKYTEGDDDRLFYIDFVGFGRDPEKWSLQNDSEDIDSVDEFLNATDLF